MAMHLKGFAAPKIREITRQPDAVWNAATIKSLTTKAKVKELIYDTFKGNIITDNIAKSTFNHSGTGFCFRVGDCVNNNIPIFEARVPRPKRIAFSYSYYNGSNIMASFVFRFFTPDRKLGWEVFNFADSHYTYEVTDYIRYNNGTVYKAIVSGNNTGSPNFNVATNLSNCFTDKGDDYIFGWYSSITYIGYNTGPVYINNFTMTF